MLSLKKLSLNSYVNWSTLYILHILNQVFLNLHSNTEELCLWNHAGRFVSIVWHISNISLMFFPWDLFKHGRIQPRKSFIRFKLFILQCLSRTVIRFWEFFPLILIQWDSENCGICIDGIISMCIRCCNKTNSVLVCSRLISPSKIIFLSFTVVYLFHNFMGLTVSKYLYEDN